MNVIFRKYFASVKMRRNFNDTFFNSINKVFICLVTSVMRHCLKSWTIGVYVEPPKTGDFKYNTSISTWNAHPRKSWTIGVYVEPPKTGDFKYNTSISTWNAHSRKTKQATQLAQQRIPNSMRHLAYTEKDEDYSLDDEHQTSDDEQTENDLDIDE
ncbi:hypothetical protein BGX38DRAFT_1138674 [Terfezia claveryi]|nr:hypothetical protein BGX38DRAFT_1138674 [Terfezia claveryi]